MRQLIFTTIGLLALANTGSFAGDLPSRYAPPPVIGGGPGTKVGVLNCALAPSIGLLIVGFQDMRCRFTSEGPELSEGYVGKMTTFGIDLGFTAGGALTWGVYAPTNNMMPGSLSGSYVGASGNIGVGVGIGENFLLGGSGNTVALQPWSVEGTTGINASLGLSNMELRPL
jgi:Protein of unknown function (DUF992)